MGRVEIATLGIGARVKEGEGRRGGKKFSSLSPPPPPLPLTRPISYSSLLEFQLGAFASKNIRARRKRLHCRLLLALEFSGIYFRVFQRGSDIDSARAKSEALNNIYC